jgi:hypothetical protein
VRGLLLSCEGLGSDHSNHRQKRGAAANEQAHRQSVSVQRKAMNGQWARTTPAGAVLGGTEQGAVLAQGWARGLGGLPAGQPQQARGGPAGGFTA